MISKKKVELRDFATNKVGLDLDLDDNDDCHLDADDVELLLLELGIEATRTLRRGKKTSGATPLEAGGLETWTGDAAGRLEGSSTGLSGILRQENLEPRSPVVSVMGHVDAGKTTLLDALRSSNRAAQEAGGITQRLAAFVVPTSEDGARSMTVLDTPGHEAFVAMRANGVQATDLIVVVVAAEAGLQPQTLEVLNLARKSNSAVVIALSKVDKLTTPVDRTKARERVLNQLLEKEWVPEDYGGEVSVVEVSGATGDGIPDLLENIALQVRETV